MRGAVLARSEVGAAPAGAKGGSGGSRDRGRGGLPLRALAGSPVGLECLTGLKSTTANLRTGQFNVFARLEVIFLENFFCILELSFDPASRSPRARAPDT